VLRYVGVKDSPCLEKTCRTIEKNKEDKKCRIVVRNKGGSSGLHKLYEEKYASKS
jgi:hypothetical protein